MDIARKRSVKLIRDLVNKDGPLQSPINISISLTKQIDLPPLRWTNFEDLPSKVKVTNMGHTVMLSAKWSQERPYVSSGPLESKYVFSQLHFHWGATDDEGSEHTVDGKTYPLEMHAIYYNGRYRTPEAALKQKDGTAVVCYFYKIESQANTKLQVIVDALPWVQEAHTAARMKPISIDTFFSTFHEDYFLYWGAVMTPHCGHPILHVICREMGGISRQQLDTFRSMKNPANTQLVNNFRSVNPLADRAVFHVNPLGSLNTTLLPYSGGRSGNH